MDVPIYIVIILFAVCIIVMFYKTETVSDYIHCFWRESESVSREENMSEKINNNKNKLNVKSYFEFWLSRESIII